MTRVAVVGAGAMGGLWAGWLAASGVDVTVVDPSVELVGAIRADGLTVVAADGAETRARVEAVATSTEIDAVDIVFVFVKGTHTRAAAATLGPLLAPDTIVATLQNGWGNAEVLAEHVPAERLVIGVTYHAATIERPGRVRHPGSGPSTVGPYVDGGHLAPAERVAGLMASAGFEVGATPDVRTAIWRKLIHNAACLAVSAVTDLTTAALVEDGPVIDLIDGLAVEATAVARALGLDIDERERLTSIHEVLAGSGTGVPSMLADVRARRPTEIATINGAVVRMAREVGVPTPLNEAMVALVEGLERGWQAERA